MRRGATPFNWLMLLPLDTSLALAILSVCVTLYVSNTTIVPQKARMAGVLGNFSTARAAAMEEFSAQGRFSAPSPGMISAPSPDEFSYQYSDGRIDSSGVLRRGGPVVQLSLRPAIMQIDGGWSVIWLCGQRKPPPGWIATTPARIENLKEDELPFVCRDLKVE